jgi:hypothetical protein
MIIKSTRQMVVMALLITALSLLLQVSGFSYVWCNKSEDGFGGNGNVEKSSAVMGYYIKESAGYMLAGYSQTLALLNRVEVSGPAGIEAPNVLEWLGGIVSSLEKARDSWTLLIRTAGATPYNPEMTTLLSGFNYQAFEHRHTPRLNPVLFKKVGDYLKKGDIRGLYLELFKDIEELLVLVNRVRATVASGEPPMLEDLWKLNHIFSDTILSGQYTAEIFYSLK